MTTIDTSAANRWVPDRRALLRPLHAAGLVVVSRHIPDVLLRRLVPDADRDTRVHVRGVLSRRAALLNGATSSWAALWDDQVAGGTVDAAPVPCTACEGRGWDSRVLRAGGPLRCVACGGRRTVTTGRYAAVPFPR